MRGARTAGAQKARRQGWAAVGGAAAHVELVHKLVHHHIGAALGVAVGIGHMLPAEHDGAALHGLTQQHLGVLVHHAGLVHRLAACHGLAGVHHDAHKIVIPAQG